MLLEEGSIHLANQYLEAYFQMVFTNEDVLEFKCYTRIEVLRHGTLKEDLVLS